MRESGTLARPAKSEAGRVTRLDSLKKKNENETENENENEKTPSVARGWWMRSEISCGNVRCPPPPREGHRPASSYRHTARARRSGVAWLESAGGEASATSSAKRSRGIRISTHTHPWWPHGGFRFRVGCGARHDPARPETRGRAGRSLRDACGDARGRHGERAERTSRRHHEARGGERSRDCGEIPTRVARHVICETRPRRSAVRVETTTGSSSSPRARAHAPMLEAKTPASAWKPSRDDGEEEAADPAAVDDDVGASTVKGGASGEAREMLTATPVPVPGSGDDSARRRTAPGASPPDERETAWWGEDLARASRRAATSSRAETETPFISSRRVRTRVIFKTNSPFETRHPSPPRARARAARRRRRRALLRVRGEYTRNEMVLLSRCGHPLCLSCAEAWAEKRGRRCATCKNVFDGWHFGEKHFSQTEPPGGASLSRADTGTDRRTRA